MFSVRVVLSVFLRPYAGAWRRIFSFGFDFFTLCDRVYYFISYLDFSTFFKKFLTKARIGDIT